MEIAERRLAEKSRTINEVSEFSKQLKQECTVVLIGSYARGDFNLWSDIDLLVVGNFKNANPVERFKEIDFPPGYDLILLKPEEFEKMKRKNNKFIADTYNEGVVLRDDFKLFE